MNLCFNAALLLGPAVAMVHQESEFKGLTTPDSIDYMCAKYLEPKAVNVGVFGCIGMMFVANRSAQLVKQLGRVSGFGYTVSRQGIFVKPKAG